MDEGAFLFDNGSAVTKAGFAGEGSPRLIHPSLIRRNSKSNVVDSFYSESSCWGSTEQPIHRGIITNWDQMQMIWDYAFQQLQVTPKDRPVLLSEPILTPLAQREKIIEIMLETYNTPAMHLSRQPLLTHFSSGRSTGLVIECGDGSVSVFPVYDYYTLHEAIFRVPYGGKDVTNYLIELIAQQGLCLNSSSDFEIAQKLKEKHCYTSSNFEMEYNNSESSTYELPDGRQITLGNERFRAAEVLFKPSLLGLECQGIHELVYQSLQAMDVDMRKDIVGNLVLAGGASLIQGFLERFNKEIVELLPINNRVKVSAPWDRQFTVWVGGSIIASLSTFQSLWVTKEEYNEFGPSIIHKKCL
jgi:actin beta/gamma 1